MRALRSGRCFPEPQLQTLISSHEALKHSRFHLLNTSTSPSSAPVANSRRSLSSNMANIVAPPFTVATDEVISKRKRSSRVCSNGYSTYTREEQYMHLRSGSRVSRRRLDAVSGIVEKQEDVEGCSEESDLVDGLADKVKTLGSKADDGFKALESLPIHKSLNGNRMVKEADRHAELHLSQKEDGYMRLRSGSKVSKRKIEDKCADTLSYRKVKRKDISPLHFECIEKSDDKVFTNGGEIASNSSDEEKCSEVKEKDDGLLVEEGPFCIGNAGISLAAYGLDGKKHISSCNESLESKNSGLPSSMDKRMDNLILEDHQLLICGTEDNLNVDSNLEQLHKKRQGGCYRKKHMQSRFTRYSREEKKKEKLVPEGLEVIDREEAIAYEVESNNAINSGKKKAENSQRRNKSRRETARNIAIELASQFAFFNAEEEKVDDEVESNDDANEEEDWPGPFSTAMKIIAEREAMLKSRKLNSSAQKDQETEVKIPWTPSRAQKCLTVKNIAPSLKELCLKVICDNAEEIESLEGLPDAIKHHITIQLCHSRRMSSRVLGLLTKGFPSEICLSDCSWATDKQFEELFSVCNIDNLKTLQLDFCGRCLPDYVLHSTLGKAPNCLPSLNRLSLKGAYCLTDVGLDAIVTSAPLLRSLNLSQCSLITSKGIFAIAEKLGAIFQELYIDDCHNVDAMLILPALMKLKCLNVLSVARLETMTDKILKYLIRTSGQNMRVLILAGCRKLTKASMKIIGEGCPQLSSLDIRSLNLTDTAIQHLVNGGCLLQTLKLCHGAFSDEALAAFLEASGGTLVELVLNNIEKIAGNTALAISRRCSLSLKKLDLSFCRKITDEALGLIVDSCLNLRVLKLFGCTQVTSVFLEGHSNPVVKIIGLKGSILDELEVPDCS